MDDDEEGAPAPPAPGAPEGVPKRGRVQWMPTATMGVQFFRCGDNGEGGEMYAGDEGSAIDSDQTGMRILGYTGYVRTRQFEHFPMPRSEISPARISSLVYLCAQAFCRGDMSLHQLSRYIAGKATLPAKYATLEKAVGYEILFMCVTPGKTPQSIFEVTPADMVGEALDEFKLLQAGYESPHHSYMMSKDGVREMFYTQLRNGILDINRHVAPSQGSTKRPFPFPEHAEYEPHRQHLTDNTLYLAQLAEADSASSEPPEDSEEDADVGRGGSQDDDDVVFIKKTKAPRVGLCDFPGCQYDDTQKRDCIICGSDGMHHHMCAINNGQEELSTMCLRCADAAGHHAAGQPPVHLESPSHPTGTRTTCIHAPLYTYMHPCTSECSMYM